MSFAVKLLRLSKQLLPTGRAWRAAFNSNMERLFKSLSLSENQAKNAAQNILMAIIPDNDDFTVDDASQWEIRLGLPSNAATPLADRKAAILRKMAAPGRNPARGHYLFIQKQLQDAGFTNLYVYENIYPDYPSGYITVNPVDLNANIFTQLQEGPIGGQDAQQGEFQQGGFINHQVVNSMDNRVDIGFDIGENLQATFFIGAGPATPGVYANVLASREKELRQLILQLKQTQAVAILFVNFI